MVSQIETIPTLVARKNGNGERCAKMAENKIHSRRRIVRGRKLGVQESQWARKGQNTKM